MSVQERRKAALQQAVRAKVKGESVGPLTSRMARVAGNTGSARGGAVCTQNNGCISVIVLALLVLGSLTFGMVRVAAHYEIDAGVGGYVHVSTLEPVQVHVVPEQVCVETSTHPCGHHVGESVAAVCGDPTCGMADVPEKCGGASPCFFCCCGCEGGCGTGEPKQEPECVVVTDPDPGNPRHCK